MNFENGGEQPANEAIISDQDSTEQGAGTAQDHIGDEADENTGEEDVEVEYEGEKFRLPPKLKDALLRQQDYTQKTMKLADDRRAFDGEREGFKGHVEAQRQHFAVSAKLAGIESQLDAYKNVDWQALYATNPDQYQQHRINFDALKDQRESAVRELSQKEQERQAHAQRESAKRMSDAQAEIARLVPEWTPGGELDLKLSAYGSKLGFDSQELGELAIRSPKLVRELNRLRLYDEAAQKQKTQQSFQQSQQAKPVTRVGGAGGSAARKTTDASGDALSTEEWVRREQERVAARRKPSGRG